MSGDRRNADDRDDQSAGSGHRGLDGDRARSRPSDQGWPGAQTAHLSCQANGERSSRPSRQLSSPAVMYEGHCSDDAAAAEHSHEPVPVHYRQRAQAAVGISARTCPTVARASTAIGVLVMTVLTVTSSIGRRAGASGCRLAQDPDQLASPAATGNAVRRWCSISCAARVTGSPGPTGTTARVITAGEVVDGGGRDRGDLDLELVEGRDHRERAVRIRLRAGNVETRTLVTSW